MDPLNGILNKLTKDFGFSRGLKLVPIRKEWERIVGSTIAAHTSPSLLKGGVLTLIVDTPQWMHHLNFFKEEIVAKLEAYRVDEVRFMLGKMPVEVKSIVDTVEPELSDNDMRYIQNTLSGIKDGDLKERLRSLLVHAVTRGKEKQE